MSGLLFLRQERQSRLMKHRRYYIAMLIAGLCWLYSIFTSEPYLYTDNVGVAIVLNGYYATPLSQYQHPLFCLLVFALSKIFPFADMYTTVVHLLIFYELVLLMAVLSGDALSKQIKNWQLPDILSFSVAVLFCIFLSAGLKLWQANYTVILFRSTILHWELNPPGKSCPSHTTFCLSVMTR